MEYLRSKYYRWLLYNKKRRALFETNTDISYLEKYKLYDTKYNEQELRAKLATENKKSPEKRDNEKVSRISEKITRHQQDVKQVQDLKLLQTDLNDYINNLYEN